jgi:hypothetical protein
MFTFTVANVSIFHIRIHGCSVTDIIIADMVIISIAMGGAYPHIAEKSITPKAIMANIMASIKTNLKGIRKIIRKVVAVDTVARE